MKASQFSDAQKAFILKQGADGVPVADNRRVENGHQVERITKLAMSSKPSVDFCGYWAP